MALSGRNAARCSFYKLKETKRYFAARAIPSFKLCDVYVKLFSLESAISNTEYHCQWCTHNLSSNHIKLWMFLWKLASYSLPSYSNLEWKFSKTNRCTVIIRAREIFKIILCLICQKYVYICHLQTKGCYWN